LRRRLRLRRFLKVTQTPWEQSVPGKQQSVPQHVCPYGQQAPVVAQRRENRSQGVAQVGRLAV
jgi:hypothetical protein